MTNERYNQLFEDKECLKINTIGGAYFRDKLNEIAISFIFSHIGFDEFNMNVPKNRVLINVFPLKNLYKEVIAMLLSEKVILLVNADEPKYALSYELRIDTNQRVIEFSLLDMPELGEKFITKDEINGIKKTY